MRLDRLVTLGVVTPLRRASLLLPGRRARPADRARRLPILMYHSVSADPEPGVRAYFRTAVTPRRFSEQMRFLQLRGWRGVSLRDGLQALAARSAEKLAAITFDDGFGDFASAAVPVLREFNFSATLFLPTAFISECGGRRRFRDRDCLTWPEVRQILAAGIEVGSHTASHPTLTDLTWPAIESEIALSKSEIESRLGCGVTSFSYPFAFPQLDAAFCARLREALIRAGYRCCVTTEVGCAAPGDDPYRLKRLPVNEEDDPALFAAKLDGDYDWLAGPQRACQALRRAL
jgi:peptidoglycan/xylan/chitin deacetylase (PgdA/CDA1 family)